MHNYLLMQRTEQLQRLAEEQRRQMEAEAKAEADRERAAQERARQLERRLSLIAGIFGAPALALTYLDAVGPVSYKLAALAGGSALAAGVLLFTLLHYLTGRK